MATSPELHEPQIAAARAKAWHQAEGEDGSAAPLLTLEAARAFVEEAGLVLFAPRPLGAPAPSLVEATLGTAKPAASAADAETARGLVARMAAEGSAVPLNLLGSAGDTPDFVVSASAFPFVFTLRGDKGWKRPPETSGAVKVTPLALRIYEVLEQKGEQTVAEITSEIGREVTDSAVTRALGELWALLRVIPLVQAGDGQTRWELSTARYQKAIKAGANAGQPTALSALVALYLRQALTATEEEIASFLSPLTARSRVRDVLHGLVAARQLSEGVIEGKTVLFVPESLPDFSTSAAAEPAEADAEEQPGDGAEAAEGEQGSRIRRFEAEASAPTDQPRKMRGKPTVRDERPARRDFGSSDRKRPSFGGAGDRGPRRFEGGARPAAGGDRPRGPRPDRPSFAKPWDEERRPRASSESGDRPSRPRSFDGPGGGDRPARPQFGADRPFRERPFRREGAGGEGRPARPFGDRPPFRRNDSAEGRPPRREFKPRQEGEGAPFRPRRTFEDRGERPEQGADRPARSFDRPARSFDRPERSFDRPARSSDRPARSFDRPARSFDRPFRGPRQDRPEGDTREGQGGERRDRPSFNRAPGGRPGGFGRPRPDRGGTGPREERSGSSDRPFRSREPRDFGAGSSDRRPNGPRGDRPQGGEFRPRPSGFRSGGPGGGGQRGPGGDRGRAPRPGGRPGFGGKPSFGGKPPFKRSGAAPRRNETPRPRRPETGSGPEGEA